MKLAALSLLNLPSAWPNAVRLITRATGGTTSYSYDNNGNMLQGDGKTLTYNAFNMPLTVSRNGTSNVFSYGADLQRYKQVLTNSSGTATTHYIDKAAEVEIKGSSTTTRVFIDDIAIVTKTQLADQSNTNYAIRYTLRDRLGSVVSLINEDNTLTEHRSYDPFGKPRKGNYQQASPATLAGIISGTPFTQRGFTYHKHLDAAQLIHMNGRVYDYNLGRFLSVDPVIQSPSDSQSLNPYSYIMNNPLAGTDPTGYCAAETGTRIKDCGDMKVEIKVDGKAVGSTVVKDVNFRSSASVNIAMSNGASQALTNLAKSTASVATPSDIGAENGKNKSTSGNHVGVTGSSESSKPTNSSTPSGDVLGTEDTDKRATEILDGFGSDTKEQAMVVMRDGTSVSPS